LNQNLIKIFVLNTEYAYRSCLEDGSWQINQFSGKEEGDYTDCNFDAHIQVSNLCLEEKSDHFLSSGEIALQVCTVTTIACNVRLTSL
jgi:hypothetical protein